MNTIGDQVPEHVRAQLEHIGRTAPVPNTPHRPNEVCDCPNPRAPRPYHCAADPARQQPDLVEYTTGDGPMVEHPA